MITDYMDKIEGFTLIKNFLSDKEEQSLIKNINKQKWTIDYQRRLQYYGYRNELFKPYDLVPSSNKIPRFLNNLINIMIDENIINEKPDQIIINEYLPGQRLIPHRDRISYFKDVIIGVSLNSGTVMQFISMKDNKQKKEIYIPRKSLYIMEGEARNKWLHGIPGRKKDNINGKFVFRDVRISITFRYVKLNKVKYY